MKDLIFCLIVFALMYLFYIICVIARGKKLEKFMSGVEVTYLKNRYKLTLKKVKPKALAHIIALTNSLIISLTILVVLKIENNILKLMVGFIILVPLIIITYHIIGIVLRKKEKNV